MTRFLEETQPSTWYQGDSSGHNLCFVWSQEAENNNEYEKNDDDGDDHNLWRTLSRNCSKHFVLFHLSPPPSYDIGAIIIPICT